MFSPDAKIVDYINLNHATYFLLIVMVSYLTPL